ncbi:MAG: hypothetical protein H0W02_16020 [Ktedonobacteraceae bacterium]|nr:hypothetical protein [Ktedonobacteraceae bacterium]
MSRFHVPLRLFAAFLLGWLFAFLNVFGTFVDALATAGNINISLSIPLLAFLLPLGAGIVATALSMGRRNKEFLLLALLTGMLAVAGWYLYWLPHMMREDAACVSCSSHGPSYTNAGILETFWIIDTILVLVSSLVTSLIFHLIRTHHRKGSSISESRTHHAEKS